MNDQNIFVRLSSNVGQFRTQMAQAGQAVRDAGKQATAMGAAGEAAGGRLSAALKRAGSEAKDLHNNMGKLKTGMAAVAAGIGVAWGTKLAGSLEQTKVAFGGLLGSAEEADAFVRELQQFAAETPFEFTGLTHASQTLLALGNTTDETVAQLRTIGDAVASIGGSPEQIDRVVLAMSQMQGKGRLAAQELNQIAEALPTVTRVAVYDQLAKSMDITREEAAKLADEGAIPAEQGMQALLDVMQNLPGAQGAMERQSRTLLGVLSSLKDQLSIAAGEGFTPLAEAIRDALFPALQQLGGMLKATMTPIGAALGDVFKALTDAFVVLAPHLPDLADAFGSLLSAVAPLLPITATLVDAILTPLVPVIQAVAGGMQFLSERTPLVTTAFFALAGALAAARLQQMATHTIMFGQALFFYTRNAIAAAGASAGLAAGLRGVLTALGPVGIALGALGLVMSAMSDTTEQAEVTQVSFAEALKKTGDAGNEAVNGVIAAKLAEEGLLPLLEEANISVEEAGRLIRDYGTGAGEGANGVGYLSHQLVWLTQNTSLSTDEQEKLQRVLMDMVFALQDDTQKAKDLGTAQKALGVSGEQAAKGQEDLIKVLEKMADPMDAYEAAEKAGQAALDARFDAEKDSMDARHEAQLEDLDRRHEAEQKAFDKGRQLLEDELAARHDAERQAMEDRHEIERDALSARNDAEREAIEVRAKERDRAYDAEARRLKDALDEQQRIERNAFEDRMEELRDLYDEQIEDEKDAWATRKEEIEWMISTTWGAERASWQQRLVNEEEAHEDRIDTLEEEGDRAVRTEEDAFDDAQKAQDRALGDRLQGLKDHNDNVKAEEERAWTDEYGRLTTHLDNQQRAEAASMTTRQTNQKTALGLQTEDLQTALDDRQGREKTNLENRQTQEDTAWETRKRNAKANYRVALDDLQTFLDDQLKKQDEFNKNLAIVASRGGADVMGVVAQLGPGVVEQMAKAGDAAFKNFLETIRASIARQGEGKTIADMISKGWIPLPPGVQGPPTPVSAVRPNAEGHYAQIAPAGAWRLWAEPETGGEAYIPLALSKRTRSTSILAQTAAHFGYGLVPMANGGMLGELAARQRHLAGMVNNVNVQVDARVAAGVDMDHAARVIGAQVGRAVNEALLDLRRQVTVKAWRN